VIVNFSLSRDFVKLNFAILFIGLLVFGLTAQSSSNLNIDKLEAEMKHYLCDGGSLCVSVRLKNTLSEAICIPHQRFPINTSILGAVPPLIELRNISTNKIARVRGLDAHFSYTDELAKSELLHYILPNLELTQTYNLDDWFQLKNRTVYKADLFVIGYYCNSLGGKRVRKVAISGQTKFETNK